MDTLFADREIRNLILDIRLSLMGGEGMAKIVVRFNNTAQSDVPLDKPVLTIGRSRKNDIVVDSMAVSRRNARIYREGPRFIVEDLKSLNGTFVNNKKVSQWILSNDDQILIGKHTLVFVDENDQSVSDTTETAGPHVEETLAPENRKEPQLLGKVYEPAAEKGLREVEGGITIISGGSAQQEIELTKGLTVAGKGDRADIKLKGIFLEKTVFVINRRPSGFTISRSGGRTITCVNGVPITDQQELKDGDVISAGKTTMQFYTKT
jgi:pSer/pThr/pTyr-binding forkhead associated (FHA) protein